MCRDFGLRHFHRHSGEQTNSYVRRTGFDPFISLLLLGAGAYPLAHRSQHHHSMHASSPSLIALDKDRFISVLVQQSWYGVQGGRDREYSRIHGMVLMDGICGGSNPLVGEVCPVWLYRDC